MFDHITRQDRIRRFGRRPPLLTPVRIIIGALIAMVLVSYVLAEFGL